MPKDIQWLFSNVLCLTERASCLMAVVCMSNDNEPGKIMVTTNTSSRKKWKTNKTTWLFSLFLFLLLSLCCTAAVISQSSKPTDVSIWKYAIFIPFQCNKYKGYNTKQIYDTVYLPPHGKVTKSNDCSILMIKCSIC